uniref:ADP-ribosylhydrolase ARH3 n=1 Tax=Mycena chlorophos TaxID=658473 RepID=A0ABQ0LE72_MYCCL|nr:predicted protein [Mycena chlorophos]
MALSTQRVTFAPAATKIRVAILSSALCDALGGPAEFSPRFSFDFVSSMIPNENFGLGKGVWTDDTSMTLALARSLATFGGQGGFDEGDQLHAYHRWFRNGELSAINRCFDIGNTTRTALSCYHPPTSNNQPEMKAQAASKALKRIAKELSGAACGGNGSLMRVLPIGLAYYQRSPEEVRELARRSSAVTHPNAVCQEACAVWSEVVARVVRSASEGTSMAKLDVLHHFASYPYQTEALRKALTSSEPSAAADEAHYAKHHPLLRLIGSFNLTSQGQTDVAARIISLLPQSKALPSSGYVVHTLVAALYAFLVTETFEDGAMLVVNMGSDADTVAAVYGGFAGAWYGTDQPEFWTERVCGWRDDLVKRNVVEEVAEELVTFATKSS